MKAKLPLHLLVLLAALISPALAHAQGAPSTAFSYQGRLEDAGLPATGLYDFTFNVFDVDVDGVALAGPLPLDAVVVSNGLFTVALDFGAGVFTGPGRWLEIAVRTNGVGDPAVLAPRTPLLPTPYSIFAGQAAGVAAGTVTPAQLSIGVPPAPGQFLSYDGGNFLWSDAGVAAGNIWSALNGNAYYNAGNVGIGTNAPTPGIRLEVLGATLLRPGNGNIQFGSPNGELGLSIIPTAGTSRADLRFNGSILKLVASTGVTPPSALNGIAITTGGYVGMGVNTPSFKLDVFSDTTTAIVGRSTVVSGVGVYGESSQFNGVRGVANNANHGAVVGVHNNGGIGVYGLTSGTGVQGDSTSVNGFGGFFRNTAGGIALGVQGTARVGVLQITGGADVAEPFKMSHGNIAKGSVVVIDEEHPGQLKLSRQSYDRRVAGIVSGANGVHPGISLQQEGVLEGGQNVALSGRVYVLADAASGAIQPGDLLTTSGTPGHAMKVSDHSRSQGAILGKAMSGLKSGQGLVLVLVTLQ